MGWAKHAIEALQRGQSCQIRPKGNSMKGKVNSGDLVTLAPVVGERRRRGPDGTQLAVGDIVLVKVSSNVYLHLITAIDLDRYQIGNNRGGTNGWVGGHCIYGIAVKIEP